MVGHDFGHQGKTNHELGCSQEEITAAWLAAQVANELLPEQIALLTGWVIGTDPACVASNHLAYEASPEDEHLLIQVLINEADIAASLMPDLALVLTRDLLQERGLSYQQDAEVRDFYESFKSQARVSSPAGMRLLKGQTLLPAGPLTEGTQKLLFQGTFPASVKAIGDARAEVMLALGNVSIQAQSKVDVEIALGEVLQNIVRHGDFNHTHDKKIYIEVFQLALNLMIQVTDTAHPVKDLGFLNLHHLASEKGGMGLDFIRKTASKYLIFTLERGNIHQLEFSDLL
jgi:anti-sigma regulatory factor (Ser/Thr protein kinase)